MRRLILAIIPALLLASQVGLAEPPCTTVYTNKPCDQPVQWDPPSKEDLYVKSQYGTHITAPPEPNSQSKPNSHIGAAAGYGYHQVVYHRHSASSGKSGGVKAPATGHRPSAGK